MNRIFHKLSMRFVVLGVLLCLARSVEPQFLLKYLDEVIGENNPHGYPYQSVSDQSQRIEPTSCQTSEITYRENSNAFVDVRFPKASIERDDEYLCTSYQVPFNGRESYVVGFTPEASMKSSHHMLVYGCDRPFSQQSIWSCGDMGQICEKGAHTLYAWARNAPPLDLPKDIGYRIGNSSGIRYFVVQMHFAKKLPAGQYDCSGFSAHVTLQPQKYYAGIFLLGAPYITIPPYSNSSADISCTNFVQAPLHVFAFRTHAHDLATVITGYRKRGSKTEMIGKGNPQWPHAFYTRVGGPIKLSRGDILMARCDYSSHRSFTTRAGMGGNDEMCNFYMMYFTDDKATANEDLSCWGNNRHPVFPSTADNMAPYPGFAGEDSIRAIEEGKASVPSVPESHRHNHHHNTDQQEQNKQTDTEKNENDLTDDALFGLTGNLRWSETVSVPDLGQVSGVGVDSVGFVHVFHRAYRVWDSRSFDIRNRFTQPNSPIMANTINVYDPVSGKILYQWGNNTFFLPHGLSLDHSNNIWLTDVALHQVFKFQYGGIGQPLLTLGTRFQPGNDKSHFCKPTDVAVDKQGMIYVSDGYCNGRVVKFSEDGRFIKSWGQRSYSDWNPPPGTFNVAHSITLVDSERGVCVADRENGRIQCFTVEGTLLKVIENKEISGSAIYAITYSEQNGGVLYAVNGQAFGLERDNVATSGFTIKYKTGEFIDRWEPSESTHLSMPHDVAVSASGRHVYVCQLKPHKVYQFTVLRGPNQITGQDIDTTKQDSLGDDLSEVKRPANETDNLLEEALPVGEIRSEQKRETTSSATATTQALNEVSVVFEKEAHSGQLTGIIVLILVAVPVLCFAIGFCYIRSRTRRLKKYQDFLTDKIPGEGSEKKSFIPKRSSSSPTGKLNLGKFFSKSNPQDQGFSRVKTVEDEGDDSESDVEENQEQDGSQLGAFSQEAYHDEK